MERTYSLERAAHARAVATAKGRRIGRPSVVSESQIAHAAALRDGGATIAEIVAKTKLTRSMLYRPLPPRPANPVTAVAPLQPVPTSTATAVPDTAVRPEDRLECPTCGYRPSTRREMIPHLDDLDTVWLHVVGDGQVHEQRHCAQCQPHDVEIVEVGCERCGVGPLVTGVGVDEGLLAAVLRWLKQRGWGTDTTLVCGSHG